MSKDIYRNKKDFAKEEFATELYKPKGIPKPRESNSQKAQFESFGSPGQFNLVKKSGKLFASENSAVGIMEEFNKSHPGFGLEGTFYVNLGLQTFQGEGSVEQRLKYLIDKGFEIGNHTFTHIKLTEVKSADKVQQEIGENQVKMDEYISGYKLTSFSLPYGLPSNDLKQYVIEGKFEDTKYKNYSIMEVGANPSVSPVSNNFNPYSIPRVRASGIYPVDMDLGWWLRNLSRSEQYVSDGNPDTVAVPKDKESGVDNSQLGNKKLILY